MSATVTPTFSFSVWPDEPRPDTAPYWNPESDSKRTSGRELAERLRPKHQTAEEQDEYSRKLVRPPRRRLRPPSQEQPVSGGGEGQQAQVEATQPQPGQSRLGFDFDPYIWAGLWWILGGAVWDKQPKYFLWWVGATVVVAGVTRPQYLLFSALFIGVGWCLLRNYLPL